MTFTVFPLQLQIDISRAINILILFVKFKMIGNTKRPFSLVLLSLSCVFSFLLLLLDRPSGFVENSAGMSD